MIQTGIDPTLLPDHFLGDLASAKMESDIHVPPEGYLMELDTRGLLKFSFLLKYD